MNDTELKDSAQVKSSVALAHALMVADMEGLYEKHTQMWEMLDRAVKTLITIASLPLLGAAALLAADSVAPTSFDSVFALPKVVVWLLLFSGVQGLLALLVAVHYRLDVILYARAINGMRAEYVALAAKGAISVKSRVLPTSTAIPAHFEPGRPMGIVVASFGMINGAYLTLAIANLQGATLSTSTVALYSVFLMLLQFAAYYMTTLREPVPQA